MTYSVNCFTVFLKTETRGGVDKSLARPGRKQTTVNKLGIHSIYSPRSSIHFLARCSNFCKPLKKIQKVVRPTRSPRQQWPPRRTKTCDLSSVQGTGGSPTGPDPENKVGDQETVSPGRAVSFGLQLGALSCKNKTLLGGLPAACVFPSKCKSIAPVEMNNTPPW